MYKIRLLSVGKTKESWLNAAIDEYVKRLKESLIIEFIWAKNDEQLVSLAEKEPFLICLDETGSQMTSEEFAVFLEKNLEKGGSRLAIVIGGAEGLSPVLKQRFPLISLSMLTFTHQLARLILVEQLYRAMEILKGSKYHK